MTILLTLLVGCGQPEHLQYDFSRSYTEAFAIQADRTRPSVVDAAYPITGVEAAQMRERVIESTTDEESGKAEAIQ